MRVCVTCRLIQRDCNCAFADFYAVRTRQFDVAAKLSRSVCLPSIMFTSALSTFLATYNPDATSPTDGGASVAMLHALLLFPSCLPIILNECGVDADTVGVGAAAVPGVVVSTEHLRWQNVLEHQLFADTESIEVGQHELL